jgi:hypothetical protein
MNSSAPKKVHVADRKGKHGETGWPLKFESGRGEVAPSRACLVTRTRENTRSEHATVPVSSQRHAVLVFSFKLLRLNRSHAPELAIPPTSICRHVFRVPEERHGYS